MDLRELPQAGFERHPWEVARARYFCDLLARRGILAQTAHVLDVGAGDAYLANQLLAVMPPGAQVVCLDPNYTDQHLIRLAAQTAAGVSFVRQPPAAPFDLLLFLDVLEHVPDDRAFLARFVAEHLAANGAVLISVPAWMALYTHHDVFVGHHRRYRRAELHRVIDAAGLHAVASGGLFYSLLLARAAQKLDELRRGVRSDPTAAVGAAGVAAEQAGVGQWRYGKIASRVIGSFLAADNHLSSRLAEAGIDVPGLSAWALCRKRVP